GRAGFEIDRAPQAAATELVVSACSGRELGVRLVIGAQPIEGYPLVTASTSSRLVRPCRTLESPERRRSSTPSRRAWAAIWAEPPGARMMSRMAAETGITW